MGVTTHELARDAWGPYLDDLSRHLGRVDVTVEVTGLDVGPQVAAEGVRLRGITYDHKARRHPRRGAAMSVPGRRRAAGA